MIELGINGAVSERYIFFPLSSFFHKVFNNLGLTFFPFFSPSGKTIVLFELTHLMLGWFYCQTSSDW